MEKGRKRKKIQGIYLVNLTSFSVSLVLSLRAPVFRGCGGETRLCFLRLRQGHIICFIASAELLFSKTHSAKKES